ncbi:MAG TPA: tRNA (adenosine(37)-N6)-threonylcarbamoyltransferase complex ATPase subunit type 1 TsaE [Desulfobulbus sp.]|nr:tRNA (adenosine(37)-N6)-threonylcarbamoyltransferase complex ATPase subunit type 1 TsaE [Desulfobulbus sp.]
MADSLTLSLADPAQTESLGRRLGAICGPGDVILLAGELGAGKTTLAGWIARGLGVPDQYHVTSPSFALLHEYPGRLPFYHMDCYRLAGEEDVEAAGLAEYLEGAGVCAIEWPDRLGGLRPESFLEIRIGSSGGEGRTVTLTAHGRSWRQRLPQLAATAGSASGPGR